MAIIQIRVFLVDILLEITVDLYGPHVITDRKGVKQLIVQRQNAIYGTMNSILLYYKTLRNILEDEGCDFNPYEPCVANKIIKGSPMSICFHVDDFKLSHKSLKVVGKAIT